MPNLVCFPHYTCGGLLCDIMAGTSSPVLSNGGIGSIQHNLGKIGDNDTVLVDYDVQQLVRQIELLSLPDDAWIGTHCWPRPEITSKFNKVISVTTATHRSKLYRWARAYHHYFLPQWQSMSGMELIDKTRETAKNYLRSFDPVTQPNVCNLEFADLVEQTEEFLNVVQGCQYQQSMSRWKEINLFLYQPNFWNSKEALAYYQAEFEVAYNRYYIYNFK